MTCACSGPQRGQPFCACMMLAMAIHRGDVNRSARDEVLANDWRYGMSDLGKVCEHGQLARVCLTCEQAAEIERLTAERDAWRKLVLEHNAECRDYCTTLNRSGACLESPCRDCPDIQFSITIPPDLEQSSEGGVT